MSEPVAPPTGWNVTSQVERTEQVPGGQYVAGYRIYFTTSMGQSGSVFCSLPLYTPDNVRALINAAAAKLDTIGSLASGN